ncbi:hypothetical protein L7F22_030791 [Adiantum nelumboides]|nr:hypothetical protein [Adiantum nelumboides]
MGKGCAAFPLHHNCGSLPLPLTIVGMATLKAEMQFDVDEAALAFAIKGQMASSFDSGHSPGASLMKRIVYINDRDLCLDSFCDDKVSNTKYTIFTFIPKNLWEQFSRFMNKYFLFIACLQLWPLITPVNPASTWGPLLFIFAVSASKEAWDDHNRYLLDKQANEKKVWIVRNGVKIQISAEDINVGDIVWFRENEEVPCDLVLLGTSEHQGICYIEIKRQRAGIFLQNCCLIATTAMTLKITSLSGLPSWFKSFLNYD